MGQISLGVPTSGQSFATEGAKVATDMTTIQTWANGNVDSNNIANSFAASAAVNTGTQTIKGVTNIATSETRTNAAYGTLTTPDQVSGIVLPSNGLIAVWYQALWQQNGTNGRAAIFVGATQLKAQVTAATAGNVVTTLAAVMPGTINVNQPLVSAGSFGIVSASTGNNPADVTTGQAVGLVGGSALAANVEIGSNIESPFPPWGTPTYIFAAAGTYTISVQFKSATGTVTASARRLWVQAFSFA